MPTLPGAKALNKFGRLGDCDATERDVWDGGASAGLHYNAVAGSVEILAGLGDTQNITIEGLDANWDEASATTALDGTTPQAVAGTWMRIFRAYVDDSSAPTTDVTVRVAGAGATHALIQIASPETFNQTLMACWTVPAGHTLYVEDWYADILQGSPAGGLDVRLYVRENGGVFRLKSNRGLQTNGTSSNSWDFREPIVVPEKADIKVSAIGSTNNFVVAAGFNGGYVANG